MNFREGVILHIDKPYAMSSFGALAHIRFLLTRRMGYKVKVGHAGTLDPLATGVLILCTGKKTKEIETLQAHDKEYVATLQLGATTASHDMEQQTCPRLRSSSFPLCNCLPSFHLASRIRSTHACPLENGFSFQSQLSCIFRCMLI